jgi:hypothetical protein
MDQKLNIDVILMNIKEAREELQKLAEKMLSQPAAVVTRVKKLLGRK